jgi:hypothetical protein
MEVGLVLRQTRDTTPSVDVSIVIVVLVQLPEQSTLPPKHARNSKRVSRTPSQVPNAEFTAQFPRSVPWSMTGPRRRAVRISAGNGMVDPSRVSNGLSVPFIRSARRKRVRTQAAVIRPPSVISLCGTDRGRSILPTLCSATPDIHSAWSRWTSMLVACRFTPSDKLSEQKTY